MPIAVSGTTYFRFGYSANSSVISQSFVAQTPDITGVSVDLIRRQNPTQPVTVSIKESLTGVPLASASIDATSITSSDYRSPSRVSAAFTAPIPVTPGKTYYLSFSVEPNSRNYYGLVVAVGNQYKSGSLYAGKTFYGSYDIAATIYSSGSIVPITSPVVSTTTPGTATSTPPTGATSTPPTATVYQGFGGATPGGAGKTPYHVTNLNDSGPGSLRDAVSQGNRYVLFDVGGVITLRSEIYVMGPFVTIDGTTAQAPGITLQNYGLIIRGTKGAHDVIVSNLRTRNAYNDGFQIAYGAYNVVLDHVSAQFSGDGNLDITETSHDVTVQWSIFEEPKEAGDPGALAASQEKNSLIKYNIWNVSLHNNIFTEARQRNPQFRVDDTTTSATTSTSGDMRNNIIWNWRGGSATAILYGVNVNVANNFYGGPAGTDFNDALAIIGAKAYVSGNVVGSGLDINRLSNVSTPFPAAAFTMSETCAAAQATLANAGPHPLDSTDQAYLSRITLASCKPAFAAAPAKTNFLAAAFGALTDPVIALGSVIAGAIASIETLFR